MTQMAKRAATDRAPVSMIAGGIALIDIAGHLGGDAESSRKAATQLRWAFENVGFYYLSGHGVPQSLIDRTYEAAARFHAQPMAKKLALKVNEHNMGYLPVSDAASPQAAAQGRKPSQNEAYFLRRERTPDDPAVIANRRFHGLNQWPDDLPGFRETTLEYRWLNACRPAARPTIPQNTRRSASAIMRCGLPARAISTWPTSRRCRTRSSRPVLAQRRAGEFDALA